MLGPLRPTMRPAWWRSWSKWAGCYSAACVSGQDGPLARNGSRISFNAFASRCAANRLCSSW